MSKITNFNKSFIPNVPLPRPMKDDLCPRCKLSRHFRHALRQVVNKADWMAGNDKTGERFIFSGLEWFRHQCKDFKTGEHFGYRMVQACWSKMKELRIITQTKRVRDGILRDGWIVISHEEITKIEGHLCVWCEPKTSSGTSSKSEKTSHATSSVFEKTSYQTSYDSEKNFVSDFVSDYPIEKAQPPQNEKIQTPLESFAGSFAGGFAAPSKVNVRECSECSSNALNSPNGNDNPNSNTGHISFSDLTSPNAAGKENQTRTIGDIPTESLEGMLDMISDGLFETGALQGYSDSYALESACRNAVKKFKAFPLSDRNGLVRIVSEVMNLLERDGLQWPPGFKPVITALRAGGPLQLSLPALETVPFVRGDVLGDSSALSFWRAELLSCKELLQKVADVEGVPQKFSQGVDFIDRVIGDLRSRNESVPEEFERVQERMRERMPPVLPKMRRNRP
jgi:hypothetical protein